MILGIGRQLRLVKFEIIRDFAQIMSLFFTSLSFPPEFRRFWGVLMTIISFDIDFFIPNSALVLFWLTTLVSWILMIWLLFLAVEKPDRLRLGEEAPNLALLSKWKRYGTQILMTILTTLYLPVARNAVQMFACRLRPWSIPEPEPVLNEFGALHHIMGVSYCYDFAHLLHILVSIFNIGFIVLLLPYQLAKIISAHRPLSNKEGHFEEDGTFALKYTKRQYYDALARDKSPYRFLYDGYELEWAHYKVIVMVIKIFILVPVVVANKQHVVIQGSVCLGILLLVTLLSFISAPFILNEDDRIDQVARLTTALTVAGGLATSLNPNRGVYIAWALNAINIFNILFMILATIFSTSTFKAFWKNLRGRVDWTEDVTSFGPEELAMEKRQRVWHNFWNAIFLFDEDLDDLQYRLLDQKKIVSEIGPDGYREGLAPASKEVSEARKYVQYHLEGLDVYYDGPVLTAAGPAPNTSLSKFGKMYIRAFPFNCFFAFDDVDEEAIIEDSQLVAFVEANKHPAIVAKRQMRQALRALSGQKVFFEHQAKGKRAMSVGVLRVIQESVTNYWSPGFKVTVTYPNGEVVTSSDALDLPGIPPEEAGGELGIGPAFELTPRVHRLLEGNKAKINARLPLIIAEQHNYREGLLEKRRKEIDDLAWSFFSAVFDNDALSRANLLAYFKNHERSPVIQGIPDKLGEGLDMLFVRRALFDVPVRGLWFCFWDQFYEDNHTLKAVINKKELLDPSYLSAIAYHLCPKSTLQALLRDEGLTKMFPDARIDALYNRLEALISAKAIASGVARSAITAAAKAARAGRRASMASDDGSSVTSRDSSATSRDSSATSRDSATSKTSARSTASSASSASSAASSKHSDESSSQMSSTWSS